MKKELNIKLSLNNRTLYTFVALGIFILISVTVFAFGTTGALTDKLDVVGNAKISGNLCLSGNCINSWSQINSSAPGGVYVGNLVKGVHTGADCISTAAGVPRPFNGTDYLCKFTGSSCPSGWTQYLSWSTTYPNSCTGAPDGNCQGTVCVTNAHTFSNNADSETCIYKDAIDYDGCWLDQSRACTSTTEEIGCY